MSIDRMRITRTALIGLSCTALSSVSFAQHYATSIAAYTQGTGGGVFTTSNLLGGPRGAGPGGGSLHVLTLGVGGSVTVGFDVTITNGPGADFVVFEKRFQTGGGVFTEVAYVEVSTDGVTFARFPSRYIGPTASAGSGLFGQYWNLPGNLPVIANVVTNTIDPRDLPLAGGDGLDLADLEQDPLVLSHQVDLAAIHFVRLVDPTPHGVATDSFGNVIWDASGSTGSADFDAIAVIQHTGTPANAPTCELSFDALGHMVLVLQDPDGFGDIDQSQLHLSFNRVPLALSRLRGLLPQTQVTPTGIVLRSAVPIQGAAGTKGVLSISVRDFAGNLVSDSLVMQG